MRAMRPLLLALAIGALAPVPAAAQYPAKTVRIIVGTSPGGSPDVFARLIAQKMSESWGQVVIENRIGANGNIAAEQVAKSAPDGYTAYVCDSAIWAINPHLYARVPYRPLEDFAGISTISTLPTFLTVHPSVPVTSYAEFIAYAKANPGKLNYASAGHGSSSHLAMAYFASLAGLDMVHIPFKSTADANNDVLAARSHAVIVPNVGAIPFVKDERIRLLGVTSRKRSAFLPGVPPVAESVPGYGFDSWFGLLAPAKTPAAVIARINAAVAKLLREPVILARLAGQGVEPRPLSPEAFERLIREDYEDMARVVKAVGRIE